MKETAITATAQELAEHLFKNRDTLPEVEFSADSDDLTFEKDGVSVSAKGWNFAIAVLNFADTYMVIGNYFGGGSPFCYDLDDDKDSSELADAISAWFSVVGCGETVYL